MRRRRGMRVTPIVMSVAASTAAAQTVPEGAQPQTVQPAPATPDGAPQIAPGPAPGQLDTNGVYTVKSGDTLWDLSGQFLNNPWYWPKIWADNPSVENPHWIYPGNRLRIRQDAEGGAGEVSGPPQSDTAPNGPNMPDLPPTPAAMEDVSRGALTVDPSIAAEDQGVDTVDITPYRMPSFLRVRVATLITDRELADTGVIAASFEPKEMLATLDRVYLTFNKLDDVRIGATYSIFRLREPVKHPITNKPFGYQTDLIGTLKIVGKQGGYAIGEIGEVVGDVNRGDRITLGAALEKTVERMPNRTTVKGVVLATDMPRLTNIGENHVVFIDKGSKDGVQDGNTFQVFAQGDGLDHVLLGQVRNKPSVLPMEAIATLLVFNVRDHSSAAMVMKSVREVNVGDAVEMRVAVAPTADGAGGD